jgi:iron complex transport system substrate-binding protein
VRVVTLLPAATEIVAALDDGSLVGISHECDYPASVRQLPRVTATPIDASAPGAAIDAEVRRLREAGRPVIGVDAEQLRRLRPDLVVTQGLCDVCALADGEVYQLASALDPAPRVLSLSATRVEEVFGDIVTVAGALGLEPAGRAMAAGLRSRLGRLVGDAPAARPRVLCVEWLEPLYLAGHWVPELVEAAGGMDVGARAGDHSVRTSWAGAAALAPEVVIVMLCGFGVERARAELAQLVDPEARRLLESVPTWILDGNAYTSRPGPRIVDGAERIRAALAGRPMPGLEPL